MTRRERLERKLEKRQQWAESRAKQSDQRFQAANDVPLPPMGEPIKIGHHSEGRHRAALRKVDQHMAKGFEHRQMAKHHASKAEGIARQLNGSIFSDDDDAVEQLEARIAEREAQREQNNAVNKIIRSKPKNQCTDEKLAKLADLGLCEHVARKLFEPDFCGRVGIPSYVNQNLGGNIKRDRDRIAAIKARAERQQAAEDAGGVTIGYTGTQQNPYAVITFAEKPDRSIINALKGAGYYWGRGSWTGPANAIPDCVRELTD